MLGQHLRTVLADGGRPVASEPLLPVHDTDSAPVVPSAKSGGDFVVPNAQRTIIPADRTNYLADVASAVKGYHEETRKMVDRQELADAMALAASRLPENADVAAAAEAAAADAAAERAMLDEYAATAAQVRAGELVYHVRG